MHKFWPTSAVIGKVEMRVVVDTNIIVKATEYNMNHLRVLLAISATEKEHKLVLDYENKLLREYEDNAGEHSLYRKWFKELQSGSKIFWSNGNLNQTHSQALIRHGLHEPEDHVVVALAANTDKYIVTEDSDFGVGNPQRAQSHSGVLTYLQRTMNITVHTAAQAVSNL